MSALLLNHKAQNETERDLTREPDMTSHVGLWSRDVSEESRWRDNDLSRYYDMRCSKKRRRRRRLDDLDCGVHCRSALYLHHSR